LVWQKWETVQVDPAQAELQSFWNRLEAQDQAYLRERCADGLVYQHVVKAYPSTAAGQMVKLMQDLADAKALLDVQTANLAAQQLAQVNAQNMWLQEKSDLLSAAAVLEESQKTAIQWLEEQLKNHQTSLAWAETQLKNHQTSLAWAEGQLQSLQTSLAHADGQLKESQNALAKAQSQIETDRFNLVQLEKQLALSEHGKQVAEEEISALKNSRSWRYTRFLRQSN
jgi:chromosome segregation ATPase